MNGNTREQDAAKKWCVAALLAQIFCKENRAASKASFSIASNQKTLAKKIEELIAKVYQLEF